MLKYKAILLKNVKIMYLLVSLVCLNLFLFLEDEYQSYVHWFSFFVFGFGMALFLNKKLFKIEIYDKNEKKIELADKAKVFDLEDFMNFLTETNIYIQDLKDISELHKFISRTEIFITRMSNNLSHIKEVKLFVNFLKEKITSMLDMSDEEFKKSLVFVDILREHEKIIEKKLKEDRFKNAKKEYKNNEKHQVS